MTLGRIVLKYPRKNNDMEKLPTLDMLVFLLFCTKIHHMPNPSAAIFMEFAASYLFETDYLHEIDNLLGHSDCSSSITTQKNAVSDHQCSEKVNSLNGFTLRMWNFVSSSWFEKLLFVLPFSKRIGEIYYYNRSKQTFRAQGCYINELF